MRDITRSVKVALKCLIVVVLVDVDLPYWTSKVEHLVAFASTVTLGELWPALTSSPARMRRPGVKHNACGRT